MAPVLRLGSATPRSQDRTPAPSATVDHSASAAPSAQPARSAIPRERVRSLTRRRLRSSNTRYQPRNMLRAVPVPGKDREDERSFDAGCLRRAGDLSGQLAVIDDLGAAPKLEPSRVRIVHQEQERAVVL